LPVIYFGDTLTKLAQQGFLCGNTIYPEQFRERRLMAVGKSAFGEKERIKKPA